MLILSEPSGEYDEEEDEEEGSDEEEDEEEDEDEDEAEGEGEDEDEDEEDLSGEQDPGDVQMTEGRTPGPPPDLQLPHLLRRQLFQPSFLSTGSIPNSLSIEAIVAIPLPSPVHSMASTLCSSYLLTGAQDGFVRAYNVWPSVNGQQLMSAQQKAAVGLGDGVNKAGVSRGWWANEVAADPSAGGPSKRAEPVYSIACEGDGLWALTGTKVITSSLTSMASILMTVRTYQLVHSSTFAWSSCAYPQRPHWLGIVHDSSPR